VPEDPAFEIVEFSVTISENHVESSVPTSFPIETGGVIADHLIHEPTTFSCVVEVTESPHVPMLDLSVVGTVEGTGYLASIVERVVTPVPVSFRGNAKLDPARSLVTETHEKLSALRLAGVEMTVITSLKDYENMIITSIELPREQLSLGRGRFTISFQQILTVTSATVSAPNPAEPRGAALKEQGAQAKTLTDEERKARIKSLGASLWDGDYNKLFGL
jgi:hypothetical protein